MQYCLLPINTELITKTIAMKKTLLILILVGLIQSINAQELSLELNQYSDPIELGKNARYNLVLTNNTNEDIILFYSPMSDYGK